MTNHVSDDAENERTLQIIAENGSDLSRPMVIDFQIVVPDEDSGQLIATEAIKQGFESSVFFDEEYDDWTCECSKEMIASAQSIGDTERLLGELAAKHGGQMDGWGTYGNDESDDDEDEEEADA